MFDGWIWNTVALAGAGTALLLARRGHARAMLLCAAIVLVAHAAHRDLVVDDAYITMRFARHLAEGHGLVFNIGERTEGFTNPLWTLALAGVVRCGGDPLAFARITGLLCALATLVLLGHWSLERQNGVPTRASAAVLLLAVNPAFATWAGSGLETPLFAFLLLASVHATSHDHLRRAGAFAALNVLVRPEAAAVPALLVIGAWLTRRTFSRRALVELTLPALVAGLSLLAARHAYYGTWLPNTYHAKVIWGIPAAVRGAEYVLRFAVHYGGLFVWSLPFMAGFLLRRGSWEIPAIVALGLLGSTVLLGGDGLPAFRFLVPVLPLGYLLLQDVFFAVASHRRTAQIVGVVCLVALGAHTANAYPAWRHHRHVMQDFVSIARWLGPRLGPDDSVAVSAIGAIGYHTRARVVDRLGLTNRDVARRRVPGGGAAGHEKYDARYVFEQHPTILTVDWNGLYPESPLDRGSEALLERLELRFDGEDLVRSSEFARDYEARSVELREDGWFVFFVRRDAALALGGNP
ncbi:MAG: hypothetical protein ACE5G2_01580 [Candidatus Krumholzibacteriia bacterium]